ncbi:MAG: tetratricopeptide repeat protein [Myxococcales bacterium]|nr:tetratricopeptide repeat protein [Myxococcales bacterium]
MKAQRWITRYPRSGERQPLISRQSSATNADPLTPSGFLLESVVERLKARLRASWVRSRRIRRRFGGFSANLYEKSGLIGNTATSGKTTAGCPATSRLNAEVRAVYERIFRWSRVVPLFGILAVLGCAGGGLRSDLVFSGDLDNHKSKLDQQLAQTPGNVDIYLRLGALEYQRQQYPSARHHLKQALALDAQNADAIYLLGLVASKEGKPREAAQHLISATELDERVAKAARKELETVLISAIREATEKSSFTEAGDLAERLEQMGIVLTPEQREWMAKAFVGQANVHFSGGYYAECQSALDRAASYSSLPEIHYHRGRVFASIGRGDESKAEFDKFVETLPIEQRAAANERIGEFYEENFRFDEGAVFYLRALESSPVLPETQWKLGTVYLKLKRPDDAMSAYRAQIDSVSAENRLNLAIDAARLFVKFQVPDHARTILKWAIGQFPNAIAPVHALARLEQSSGRKAEALTAYSNYLSVNEGPVAAQEVASALQDVGLFSEAIAVLQKQKQDGVLGKDAVVMAAHLYHLDGNASERDRLFAEYVAASSDKADAEAIVGLRYASYRLPTEALKYLQRAHEARPGRQDVALALADLYVSMGDKGGETKVLKRFVAAADDVRVAQLAVGTRYVLAGDGGAAMPYLTAAAAGNDEVAATAYLEIGKLALKEKPADFGAAEAAFRKYLAYTEEKISALEDLIGRVAPHHPMVGFLAEIYEQLLTITPKDSSRLLQLAQAYASAKQFDRATQTLARYVDASPDRLAATRTAIEQCVVGGRPEDALKLVESLGPADLDDPMLSKELGDLYSRKTKYRDSRLARGYYERYLSSPQSDTRDMRAFGDQMFEMRLFDLAARAYRRAMARSGETETVLVRLAESYLHLRQPADALPLLRSYVDTKPNRWQAMDEVGQLWIRHGYLSRAVEVYREAFESNVGKQMESALHRLFDLYVALGQTDRLPELGRAYLEQQNHRRNALRKLAALYSAAGLRAEALTVRAKMREGGSTLGDALLAYERDLFRLGDDPRAVEMVKETAAESGLKPAVVIEAARLLRNEGFGDEALALYDRALARHATDSDLLTGRAELRFHKGDFDGGHTDFFTALLNSRNPNTVLDFAGEKYGEFGQSKKMLDLIQRAIQVNPQRPEHYLRLVKVYLQTGSAVEADQAAVAFLQRNEFGAVDLAPIYAAAGYYDQAIRYYMAAIERANFEDESGNLIGRLVELMLSSGQVDELAQVLTRYRLNAGASTQADLNVFEACFAAGRFEEAMEAWQRSGTDIRNIKVDHVLMLARTAFLLGKDAEGLQWVEYARDRSPEATSGDEAGGEPFLLACKTLVGANKKALAIRWLDQAIENGNISGASLAYALSLHLADGSDTMVLDRFRMAVSNGWSTSRGSLDDVGAVLVAHRLEREAAATLEEISHIDRDVETGTLLLRLYLRLGEAEKAKSMEMRLLTHGTPSDSGVVLAVAAVYAHELKLEHAANLARQVTMRGEPDFWRKGLGLWCRLLVMDGKGKDVQNVFGDVAKVVEDKQQLLAAYVDIAGDLGLWQLADDATTELARLAPDQPEPVEKLVYIRMMAGDDAGVWRAVDDYVQRVATGEENALRHLTQVFSRNLRPDLAEQAADKLLLRDPNNAWITASAAQYAMESLKMDRVLRYLSRYREIHEDKVRVALDSARLFLFGGYEADAQKALDDVFDYAKNRWEFWYVQAQLDLATGDPQKSESSFRKAAEVAPQPAQVLNLAAELVFSNPQMPTEIAKSLATEALAVKPRLCGSLAARAAAHLSDGDAASAENDARNVDDIGYDRGTYLGWIAERAVKTKHVDVFDLAVRTVIETTAVRQGRASALETAIGIVRKAVNVDAVKGIMTDAPEFRSRTVGWLDELDLDPKLTGWTMTWRSDVLESMGDYNGAQQVYRDMIRAFPADSSAYNNLSYLFARRNENLDEALTLVRKARALDPSNNVFYLDTEGWVEYQLGNYSKAAELIKGSIRLMSSNLGASVSESYWHLGKTYEAMGDPTRAAQQFRRAAMVDPTGAYGLMAKDDLRRLLQKAGQAEETTPNFLRFGSLEPR